MQHELELRYLFQREIRMKIMLTLCSQGMLFTQTLQETFEKESEISNIFFSLSGVWTTPGEQSAPSYHII